MKNAINFQILRALLKKERGISISRKVVSNLVRNGEIPYAFKFYITGKRYRWAIEMEHAKKFITNYTPKKVGGRGKDKGPRKSRITGYKFR